MPFPGANGSGRIFDTVVLSVLVFLLFWATGFLEDFLTSSFGLAFVRAFLAGGAVTSALGAGLFLVRVTVGMVKNWELLRRMELKLKFIADTKLVGFISGEIGTTKQIMKNECLFEFGLDLCCALTVTRTPEMKHVGSFESMSLLLHIS